MSSSGLRSGRRRSAQDQQMSGQNACIDLTVDIGGDEVIDLTHYHSNLMDSPVVILSPTDDVGAIIRRRRRGTGRRVRWPISNRRRHEETTAMSPLSINMPSSSSADTVDLDNGDDVYEGAIIRRRTGSGRRGLRRSYSNSRRHQETASTDMPSSSSTGPVDLVHSDDELPDIPFDIPTPSSQANANYLQSPALKISCPVCLDDLKQITSSKRRIMSTICGHIFCEECITSAIRSLRSCPSCRKSLSLNKIHPIFL